MHIPKIITIIKTALTASDVAKNAPPTIKIFKFKFAWRRNRKKETYLCKQY